VAGAYYVAVLLDPVQASLSGRVMQIRLRVAIDGTPAGDPVYASTSPSTPSSSPPDKASEPPTNGRTSTTSTTSAAGRLLVAAGALVAVGLGTGVVVGLRRRNAARR
jgi:Ca-activated chloride channel family protein